jgi:hypothetical protein
MTIFVDNMRMRAKVGRIDARWSHLFTDQVDKTELHEFAARIGLKRAWFQHKDGAGWQDHYDVTDSVRARAVVAGAVEVDFISGTGEMMRRLRAEHIAHAERGRR